MSESGYSTQYAWRGKTVIYSLFSLPFSLSSFHLQPGIWCLIIASGSLASVPSFPHGFLLSFTNSYATTVHILFDGSFVLALQQCSYSTSAYCSPLSPSSLCCS